MPHPLPRVLWPATGSAGLAPARAGDLLAVLQGWKRCLIDAARGVAQRLRRHERLSEFDGGALRDVGLGHASGARCVLTPNAERWR
jgi:hypothetical protein